MIEDLDPRMVDEVIKLLRDLISTLRPIVMANNDARLEWAYTQLRQVLRAFEKRR